MRLAIKLAAAAALVAASAGTASALSAQSCAPGYKGVVVEHDGHYTSVCTNI